MVVIDFFIRIGLLLFQIYYICIRNLMSTKCIQNIFDKFNEKLVISCNGLAESTVKNYFFV